MASGDMLFELRAPMGVSPATTGAQPDWVVGASTPNEVLPVIAFDPDADEYFDFYLSMPSYYDGGGLTCKVEIQTETDTANEVRIEIALRRREAADDWDTTSHTYDYNGVTIASPGTVGLMTSGDVTFTSGADMDSVAAGDSFVLRVHRDYDHANDDALNDCYIERIYVTET